MAHLALRILVMRLLKSPLLYVWIAIVGAFVIAANLPVRVTFTQGITETKRNSEGEKTASDKGSASGVTTRKKDAAKPNVQEQDCATCNEHDKADLYEQRRMAETAEKQYWVGIGGLGALILTLLLSIRATNAATRAANAAERALTDLERPHVFVEVQKAGLRHNYSDGSFRLSSGRFEHKCVNYGRTPAALTEYFTKIMVLNAGNFPAPIDPDIERGRELPTGCVTSEAIPYVEGDSAMKTYDWKLLNAEAMRTYSIYFVGYVRYRDMIFGAKYINGFCFLYDEIGGKFVRRGDNQRYNYTRKEPNTSG